MSIKCHFSLSFELNSNKVALKLCYKLGAGFFCRIAPWPCDTSTFNRGPGLRFSARYRPDNRCRWFPMVKCHQGYDLDIGRTAVASQAGSTDFFLDPSVVQRPSAATRRRSRSVCSAWNSPWVEMRSALAMEWARPTSLPRTCSWTKVPCYAYGVSPAWMLDESFLTGKSLKAGFIFYYSWIVNVRAIGRRTEKITTLFAHPGRITRQVHSREFSRLSLNVSDLKGTLVLWFLYEDCRTASATIIRRRYPWAHSICPQKQNQIR